MKTLLSLLLVAMLGAGAFHAQTRGLTTFTTETARRADIAREPRALPDAALTLPSGGQTGLLRDLREDGRIAIVNFIYTRCMSLCLAMGSEMQQLQDALRRNGGAKHVRVLSLSFDPADTPPYLARYGEVMHADPDIWRFATLGNKRERDALLKAAGIIVVPAPYGQYEHNAAYHVVSPDGRLLRIFDLNDIDPVLDYVMRRAERGNGAAIALPDAEDGGRGVPGQRGALPTQSPATVGEGRPQ